MFDFDALSLDELKDLRGRVDKAIRDFDRRQRKAALAAAEEAVRARGFRLSELVDGKGARSAKHRGSLPAKYANPADRSQTWSGQGRRPSWVKAHLDADGTLDDLLI